jgi:site-specific recombinase XerD
MTNAHVELVLRDAADERERLICWLMFGAGLRCVEVSRLMMDDYEPAGAILFVVGKGGHQRFVPIGPEVRWPLSPRAQICRCLGPVRRVR